MERARSSRTGKKSALTRKINAAKQCLTDSCSDQIARHLQKEIRDKLVACSIANMGLMDLFSTEAEFDEAETWYADVEEDADSMLRMIDEYLNESSSSDSDSGTKKHRRRSGDPKTQPVADPNTSTTTSTSTSTRNDIDSWIDELVLNQETQIVNPQAVTMNEVLLRAMFEKEAPAIELSKFDGEAIKWPNFILRFHELVHKQAYFTDFRRMTILESHLEGQAKLVVTGLGGDGQSYALALKTLKKRFANSSTIARAFIERITKGPVLPDGDKSALELLQIHVRDCVTGLAKMKFTADLKSCETIRNVSLRLPQRVRDRWGEKCRLLREHDHEPSLQDLSTWLDDRVAAVCDPLVVDDKKGRSGSSSGAGHSGRSGNFSMDDRGKVSCPACRRDHLLYRCNEFKGMDSQKRIGLVVKSRLCVNCLKPGHSYRSCTLGGCRVDGCSKRHHSLLHENPSLSSVKGHGTGGSIPPYQTKSPGPTPPPKSANNGDKEPRPNPPSHETQQQTTEKDGTYSVTTSSAENRRGGHVFLQIVPVIVATASGQSSETYALLDNGSSTSLIKDSLATKLRLRGNPEPLHLATVSDADFIHESCRVTFTVSSTEDEATTFKVPWAWTVPQLNIPPQVFSSPEELARLCELADGYPFRTVDEEDIGLLIGGNTQDAILPIEVRKGDPGMPAVIRTALGWSILGRSTLPSYTSHCGYSASVSESPFTKLMDSFWTTESFGCRYDFKVPTSTEDKKAAEKLEAETKLVDGRYEVPMLWKNDEPKLHNNYVMALKRLHSIQQKFRTDPQRFSRYSAAIHAQLDAEYARKMTPAEVRQTSPITNYLPHHDVYSLNKPDKIRVVQDAAAKYRGVSLNGELVSGPDLLNSLVEILFNFRVGSVALTGDIEAMFHRVLTNQADRDALRFLWSDDLSAEKPDVYQMNVHIFGSKSSLTCAVYALQRCAQDNRDKFSKETVDAVLRSFYVDDLCTSQPTPAAAAELAKDLVDLLSLGGFRLTKWTSNSREVLETLPKSELARQDINLDLDALPYERVLGFVWDPETDQLTFRYKKPSETPTKRGVLKTIASQFDPVGVLAPYVFIAKRIMQDTWTTDLGWDQPLTDPIARQWQSWLAELPKITEVKIPRCYSPDMWNAAKRELHVFVDASERGFAAVAYLRIVSDVGTIDVAFVAGRSRNAPVKPLTIPRLELQAALLGSRLSVSITNGICRPIENVLFWSDSMVTLQVIRNSAKRFGPFTANRKAEINSISNPDQWRFISTHVNPADDCCRGLTVTDIIKPGHRWLNGPAFLNGSEDTWPAPVNVGNLPDDYPDVKAEQTSAAASVTDADSKAESTLFNIERYSRLGHVLRRTAWIQRYISNLKAKWKSGTFKRGPLTPAELDTALMYWIQDAQSREFQEEIANQKAGKPLSSKSSILRLVPALVEDKLRVGGRLEKAPIDYDMKHQLILPQHHHLTTLLIADAHEKVGHHGQEHVLSRLRERFWIVKARVQVRKLVRSCVICHRRRAMPQIPEMSPLPESRLALEEPPFSRAAVDYYGPLLVKRGRGNEKRWVCLFTCMTTRAVHLEIANSLSADAFILALKRLAGRRGCPCQITSDNGTNFRGADKELREAIAAIDNEKIADAAAGMGIEWRFNPPYGSHFGGVFERLVRSVKTTMRIVLSDAKSYHEDVLHTALIEAESIINSRPLTAVSDDPTDLNALTPNHFLIGRANPRIPPDISINPASTHRRRWRHAQALAQHFWKRFRREYLPKLAPRTRWHKPVRRIQTDDLVLITHDDLPRSQWAMGRVIQPIAGKDGKVRVAELYTNRGVITRPVARLCLLEASSDS